MTKFLITALILIFSSCTSNAQDELNINSREILEVGLRELNASGLMELSRSHDDDGLKLFNNRSFKHEALANMQVIPDSLGGFAVVPAEILFTNNQGIGLKSMGRKGETYEIVFWDSGTSGKYQVVLSLQLKVISIDYTNEE